MSLKQDIERMQQEMLPQIPGEILDKFVSATEELVRSGIAERCLKEGEQAPSFSLPNAVGEMIRSDELLEKGSIVINFYRGNW